MDRGFFREWVVPFVVISAVFAILIGGLVWGVSCNYEKHSAVTIDEGFVAAGAGVPANANPYTGRDSTLARYWLHGYTTYLIEKRKSGGK